MLDNFRAKLCTFRNKGKTGKTGADPQKDTEKNGNRQRDVRSYVKTYARTDKYNLSIFLRTSVNKFFVRDTFRRLA